MSETPDVVVVDARLFVKFTDSEKSRNSDDERCPGCNHWLTMHVRENGCMVDWQYDENGLSLNQGCECQLAHAELSPTEKAFWRTNVTEYGKDET